MSGEIERCPLAALGDPQGNNAVGPLDDFRNLFGVASLEEQYQGFGPGRENDTREMLLNLEACMVGPEAAGHKDLDSGIPAGYTYLAQLAAHDLVQNETPLPRHRIAGRSRTNIRHRRLMLETIYGNGPGAIPYAYENEKPDRGGSRTRLRLHKVPSDADDHGCSSEYGRTRDLPRMTPADLSGPASEDEDLIDVLIADPRNDDHLIIAQLTVVFHLLHNWIDDHLRQNENGQEMAGIADEVRFRNSRRITTYLYRRVIFKDLLRRILDPRIYDYYENNHGRLDENTDQRIPVEFSHAVFRAGHAMVRSFYHLNRAPEADNVPLRKILDRTALQLPDLLPHPQSWWIQWSAFFEIAGPQDGAGQGGPFRRPQQSNRLSPSITQKLITEEAFQLGGRGPGGLVAHDLLRGAFSGLRSVDSLAKRVAKSLPKEIGRAGLLHDKEARRDSLLAWLNENRQGFGGRNLSDEQIHCLADDPPLLLFTLVEATHDHAGREEKGFGLLGSAIVAETFYQARDLTRTQIEEDNEIQALAATLFDGDVPDTMPKLIESLAVGTDLSGPTCRFL